MTTPPRPPVPPPVTEPAMVAVRVEALRRFLAATDRYLPTDRLEAARATLAHATQRLALSDRHTVVALAGATGGGKSSLFNALAGRDVSPVGAHRPTTGEPYACVWGSPEAAADLLDWLKVPPAHRYTSADDGGGDLRGLVLLDLPDFDSLDSGHAAEVARLLGQVDLVVWVMDPQKYADRVVHEEHLSRCRHHRDVTVVALNQADLLSAADLDRLLTDLRRLLAEDGLDGVFTIATSAVDTPAGLAQLRARLAEAASGHTVQGRLSGDLDRVAAELADLVTGAVAGDETGLRDELVRGLSRVAGAGAAAEVTAAAYRRRGATETGWPVLRWLARLLPAPPQPGAPADPDDPDPSAGRDHPGRPDPLAGRDHPGRPDRAVRPESSRRLAARAAPARDVGQLAGAGLVVREAARRYSDDLPEPWRHVVTAAARSRLDTLPAALEAALAGVDIDTVRPPAWWRVARVAQWIAAAAAVTGLVLLVLQLLLAAVGWPAPLGSGAAPAWLIVGGLAGGLLIALVTRPMVHRAARGAREGVAEQLRLAISAVAQEQVVAPVQAVQRAYLEAQEAVAAISR